MVSSIKHTPPWAAFWVRHHRSSFIGALLLTVVALCFLPRLELDFSPDRLFASDEPDYIYYQKHVAPVFGADDKVCIIAVKGDLAKAQTKAMLTTLVPALRAMPFVVEVLSPLDMLLPAQGPLDLISYNKLSPIPQNAIQEAAEHPLYRSFLISKDAKSFAIYARLQPKWEKMKEQDVAVRTIANTVRAIQDAHPELSFSLAGVPASQERIVTTLIQEQLIFVPIVFILLSLFLYLIFRDLRGVFIPFIVTAVAALWCVGWMSALGHDINIVNNSIVILIVVIGVADSMHIFSRYLEESSKTPLSEEASNQTVVVRTVGAMALPCLLTTSTTAIGFLAALSASMEVIRTFGLEAAIGVLGAYVATMTLMPALLIFFPKPVFPAQWTYPSQFSARSFLQRILEMALRHRLLIGVVALITLGFSLYGLQNLKANQYLVDELPQNDPTVQSTRFIEDQFSGVLPFAILFEGPPAALNSPDAIRAMAKLTEAIEAHSIGAQALSFADLHQSLWIALNPGKESPVSQWSNAQVEQISLLLETLPEEYRKAFDRYLMSNDGDMIRLVGFCPDAGSAAFSKFQADLNEHIKTFRLPNINITLTGGQVYATSVFENLFGDLLSSILVAFLFIFVFTAVLFRSLIFSLIAVLPNALPILFTLALMSMAELDLKISTIVVFPMALGIAVDACIHLIARWQEESMVIKPKTSSEIQQALHQTVTTSGQPVLFSILIFLFGLSVLSFSRFGALQELGMLSSITLGAALAVDLALLPVALYLQAFVRRRARHAAPIDDSGVH